MADNKFLTNFNNLQEQIYQRLNPNPQSASALKDTLARAMRPGTDRQLGTIKKNLASTKAGIDVDSSTRGVGGSSYNTDAKLRAEQMAAQNAADVEGNYQANLYNALLSRLNAQDELAMSARNNAFGLAQGLYGSVYPNETGGGGGGGYYYGRSPGKEKKEEEPPFDPFANKQVANAMFWGEGQANKAAAEQRAAANKYNNAVTSGNARTAAEKAKAAAQAAAQAKKKNAMYEMKSGNLSK